MMVYVELLDDHRAAVRSVAKDTVLAATQEEYHPDHLNSLMDMAKEQGWDIVGVVGFGPQINKKLRVEI